MRFFKTLNLTILFVILFALSTSCNDTRDKSHEAKIEFFSLQPELNNDLDEAVMGEISEYTIKLSVPYNVSTTNLIVTFNYSGVRVEAANIEQISGVTSNDFSSPVVYKVISSNGETAEYTVIVTNNLPRVPRVFINVEGGAEFRDDEKEIYKNATVRILDLDNYYTSNTEFVGDGEIKGRGNSTWWGVPKKPYRIKLDEKKSLLGMSNDKNWALLANYYDKTLLRNITAFEMSRIAEMNWTPRSVSVEYYMNGTFRGVYTLTEHVRVSDERINMELVSPNDNSGEALSGGYLLEVDFHFDEPYKFKTKKKELPVMFKDPEEPTSNQLEYVQNYFNTAEEILYSDNFTDPDYGYRKYIDVASFINYYIVQELSKNVDGNMRASCYMAIPKNGKLEFPLVWDFDLALGNADYITWEQGATSREWDGWFIKTCSPWYDRLFEDPEFVAELKTRWNELKPELNKLPDFIRERAELLDESQERNYSPKPYGAGWSITKPEWNTSIIRGSYDNEVNYLVFFVTKRLQWLDTNINGL